MAGINYETDIIDSLKRINTGMDINRGKVSSYYGIGGFMNKMCASIDKLDNELTNIKESFYKYNEAINNVPLPDSPDDVEKNISGDAKYRKSNMNIDEEII